MASSQHKSFRKVCSYYFKRFNSLDITLGNSISSETKLIVVIPAIDEANITDTLSSLADCVEPAGEVAVFIVVNSGASAASDVLAQNENCLEEIGKFISTLGKSWISFYPLPALNLPDKNAGVGLARKIGMDEALGQFSGINTNGVIVCLDADCIVKSNYFTSILNHYSGKARSACIYFEHSWREEEDPITEQGIISYELSLRYFVEGLKYAGFPHSYHTVGSCMTVTAETYALAGGMNKRQAGEDFYFINKLIPLGAFGFINDTCVYPSGRISDRVPFGTGKALRDWKAFKHKEQNGVFLSYSLETFKDIRETIPLLASLHGCDDSIKFNGKIENFPQSVAGFFQDQGLSDKVKELNRETSSRDQFVQRLLLWWSGLRMVKYVHYARDHHYPLCDLQVETLKLLSELKLENTQPENVLGILETYRKLELRLN
ncbi:MAG: hypothetical protein COB85_06055 [Bacteroidetes bacterium]|nr:MAG: hypothetical protein COB85_06055 [Bacteroidota bacterium]